MSVRYLVHNRVELALHELRGPLAGGSTDRPLLLLPGLGAYIALLLAGARPQLVRGAVLCDGPGLAGGAIGPTSLSIFTLPSRPQPPDPYALLEMSRDLRPPDYASLFARLALEGGLLEPISVAGIIRPPWLAAVVEEAGVVTCKIEDALASYAGV